MMQAVVTLPAFPWLHGAAQTARSAFVRGRLGHGILIHASAGAGSAELARWLAALVLCDEPSSAGDSRPCGTCTSCTLRIAGTHPDLQWIEREEGAKQLKVEQIRDLTQSLALKSYRGGYKVAVIAEADAMNANAANALLKTLEEPPPATLVVLCSARPSRLPPTVVSRCQHLQVALPSREAALHWLGEQKASASWPTILEHAAGEPLRALELEASGFTDLDREMTAALEKLRRRDLDIPGTADRWAKGGLDRRLAWLDVWLARTIREALLSAPALPSPPGGRNIRALYGLLDRVRAFRLELDTSLNMQLATEVVLLHAEYAVAN